MEGSQTNSDTGGRLKPAAPLKGKWRERGTVASQACGKKYQRKEVFFEEKKYRGGGEIWEERKNGFFRSEG